MSRVILVRHAMPEVVQGTSSKLWGLGDSSREDCVLLAHALPPGIPRIISSDERKAKETADVIGLRLGVEVEIDPRFQEVDRPQVWDRDYRKVAAGYLAGMHEPGWESQDSVVARFAAGIEQAVATFGDGILVSNHGMALSLWVDSVVNIDLVPWWTALTFPDAWLVDTEAKTLEHLWMGGIQGE